MRPLAPAVKMGRKAIITVLSFLIVSSSAFLFFDPGDVSATAPAIDGAGEDAAALTPTADLSLLNRFIVNEGQWPSDVDFVATTNFGSAAFTSDGFFYYLAAPDNVTEVVSFKFVGGNGITPVGAMKLLSTSNYFLGSDPSAWRTAIPEYGSIVYSNLWDGVDLEFYFVNGDLKYEFRVAAGVSADIVAVQVKGAAIAVQDGDLVITAANNSIVDGGLMAYYADDHSVVEASFVVRDDAYSFELGRDISRAVVIDPLVYSTYLGGSSTDDGTGIAVDSSGNVYVTGDTQSTNFPVSDDAYQATISVYLDAFVTKLNADGSLAYSTYLGGSEGDSSNSIAVDSYGCAYVTGYTNSRDFPTTDGAKQTIYGGDNYDAFVTKLNADGSLAYSTYLGGYNYDMGNGIAVDSSGCVYVTGEAWSGNFPITDGAYQMTKGDLRDTFVTKLNADGSALVYSTFLGGNRTDIAYGIAVDTSGCAYLTGYTYSSNFPVTAGAYQSYPGDGNINAFITRLNADGSALIYSTYLGGAGHEIGNSIAVDSSGYAYVTGHTTSADFPTLNAFQPSLKGYYDAFVTKLNPMGGLAYSTYLGGNGDEGYSTSKHQLGIAVDLSGFTYVTGFTSSTDFPITAGAFKTINGGSYDAFVAMFDSIGGLAYSTYLGGSKNDYGHSIALDSYGCVYVVGETLSWNFPVTDGAYQPTLNGGYLEDAFVTKLSLVPGTPRSLTAIPGQTNVSLSWTAPTKSDSEIVDNYAIYQDGVQIAVVTGTSHRITGLVADRTYQFDISAHNVFGNGPKAALSVKPGIYVTVEASASSPYANATTMSSVIIDVSAGSDLPSITLLSGNVSHYVNGAFVSNEPIIVDSGSYSNAFSPLLVKGINKFSYTFNDSAGNSINKSVAVVHDMTDPSVTITTPTAGACINAISVTVSWIAADDLSNIARIEYSADGVSWTTTTDSSIALAFSNGAHTVYIRAIDNSGNQNIDSISFTVDTVAPTVEFITPANNSFNNTGSAIVRWTVDDATSGVKTVEYSLDGTTWTDADGANTFTWSGLADGIHMFHMRAGDNARNLKEASLVLMVDTVKPSMVIDEPVDNSFSKTGSVIMSWAAGDDRSGLSHYTVSIDSKAPFQVDAESTEHMFDGLDDDLHAVEIIAFDKAGNEQSAKVSFTVDTTAPTIRFLSPADGSSNNTGSVIIQWAASDVNIKTVEYSLDGTTWIMTNDDGFVWTDLTDGTYTFYVRAEDNAGNVESDDVSFTVDTIAPSVIIETPSQGDWFNTTSQKVAWTANDDVAPASHYWVKVDNKGWTEVTTPSYDILDLAAGTHTVVVRAFDLAGNYHDDEVTFNIELSAPDLSIITPIDGSYNVTGEVRVQWTGSAASGIASYWIRLDGGDWFDADMSTSHLFESLIDGEYTVTVNGQTVAGNWNEISIGFIVDSVAPTVVIASPSDSSYLNASSVNVAWTVDDATSGVKTVEYSLDGTIWTMTNDDGFVWTDLTDSPHTFFLRVEDKAGHGSEASLAFIVDTIAPTFALLSPSNGSYFNTTSVIITWTALDDVHPAYFLVRLDGGAWQQLDLGAASKVFEDLADGQHTVDIKAVDHASNSRMSIVTFVVDTVNPSIVSKAPTDIDASTTGAVSVTFSEAMNRSAMIVKVNGVIATFEWVGDVVILPQISLAYNTNYEVSISGKDLAGNGISTAWSFSTMKNEGAVSGTVKDSNGNAVANANVTLGGMTTITDENGHFVLKNVTSGVYEIKVSKDGYEAMTQSVTTSAGVTTDMGTLSLKSTTNNVALVIVAIVAFAAILLAAGFVFVKKKT